MGLLAAHRGSLWAAVLVTLSCGKPSTCGEDPVRLAEAYLEAVLAADSLAVERLASEEAEIEIVPAAWPPLDSIHVILNESGGDSTVVVFEEVVEDDDNAGVRFIELRQLLVQLKCERGEWKVDRVAG